MGGQGTTWLRNIAENFNRLSRAHERYRRQSEGRAMTYSEREREFTLKQIKVIELLLMCVKYY